MFSLTPTKGVIRLSLDNLLENVRSAVKAGLGAQDGLATAKSVYAEAFVAIVKAIYAAASGGVSIDTIKDECQEFKALKSGASVHAANFTGQLLSLTAAGDPITDDKVESVVSLVRRVYNTSGGSQALKHVFATKREQGAAYEAIKALDPKKTVESMLADTLKTITKVSEAGVDWSDEGDVTFGKVREVMAVLSERRTEYLLAQAVTVDETGQHYDADQQPITLPV
jgi:hypothetical protein